MGGGGLQKNCLGETIKVFSGVFWQCEKTSQKNAAYIYTCFFKQEKKQWMSMGKKTPQTANKHPTNRAKQR